MPGSSIFGHVVCDRLGGCQYLTAPHTRTGFWSGAANELEDEGVGNSWKDQGRVTAQLTAVRYCPLISFFCRPSTLYFPLLPAAEDQSLACAYAALILHDGGKSIEAVSLPILRVLLQKARSASSCSAPPRLGLDILFVSPRTRWVPHGTSSPGNARDPDLECAINSRYFLCHAAPCLISFSRLVCRVPWTRCWWQQA